MDYVNILGIIETMDEKVDPCENFYQYSCGNWLKNTPIPDSRTRYSRFEKLSEQNSIVIKQILNQLITKQKNASVSIRLPHAASIPPSKYPFTTHGKYTTQ